MSQRSQLLARLIARKAAATAPQVVAPSGPGGLLSAAGLSPAMRAKRDKARRRHKADGPSPIVAQKVMRPGRKRLWQRAYRQAKAEGLDLAQARAQARAALRASDKDRAWRGYERAIARMGKAAGDFAVFKDAQGRDRWLARATTAYQDRDGEILALSALDADSRRMTRTGQYGPLRYWHAGRPELGTPDTPWGPGLDIGTCDLSIVIGRTRYESGTFQSPELARVFKAGADQYELSPGFYHPYGPAGPRDGVFRDIQTFERSVVPTRHARAANLFTGLTVKEFRMDERELERRIKAFVADMQGRGVDPSMTLAVLGQGATAEKSADARGVAYKSLPAQRPATPAAPAEITVNGQTYTLKAPMAGMEMVDAGLTETADGLARAADAPPPEDLAEPEPEESEDRLLSDAEIGMIADAVAARLMGRLSEVQGAVAMLDEQMKGYGYARKEQDALKAQVASLGQQLTAFTKVVREFTDDLPAGGHRASQDAATVLAPDDALATAAAKNAQAQQRPASVIDRIAATLPQSIGGAPGGIPWPFDVAPPQGVNVQQHAAPGLNGNGAAPQ